jgi:predicted transcriptional regulator
MRALRLRTMSADVRQSRAPLPQSLVTIAYLKARYDEHADHLDMFRSLVMDAVSSIEVETFTAADVQSALMMRHGLAMPQHTVNTLLARVARSKGIAIEKDGHTYRFKSRVRQAPDIQVEQSRIEEEQRRLAEALRAHALRRDIEIESDERALELVIGLVEEQQVGLLLNGSPSLGTGGGNTSKEMGVVAEFVRHVVEHVPELASTIKAILEGLVLYRAAFLPDLNHARKQFSNLRVYFDGRIVRQALGYEGDALKVLARETLKVLKAAGIQALVLDKTVFEIRRILTMYENKLGTAAGRRSLRPVEMTRQLLTQRATPADVAQMIALLDRDIFAAGFQVAPTPQHVAQYTLDEKALAELIADPAAGDEGSPRVVHDVDCVAAVLTVRRGHRASRLEDAGAVFVTDVALLVRNVTKWFNAQGETGVAPIVHIRALANLAWLKRPATLAGDFKLRELVALCCAALHPRRETWERFLRHLDALKESNAITSDEAAAIVVSDLADRLLGEAELADGDSESPDARTLDEIVASVRASYSADADARVSMEHAARAAEMSASQRREEAITIQAVSTGERLRSLEMSLDGRARQIAVGVVGGAYWIAVAVVLGGALALLAGHPLHGGWIGRASGGLVALFVVMEMVGLLGHLRHLRARAEASLTAWARRWFAPVRQSATPGADPAWVVDHRSSVYPDHV